MALTKQKLIYDTADAASSDNVGAYLKASDGTLITHTGGALDVNIASSSGMGIYAEDAAHTSGDQGQLGLAVRKDTEGSLVDTDGDYSPLQLDSSGRLRVSADVDVKSDVADDAADTENPLKVGSRALDGALSAISASGDKADLLSDMYRRVYVNSAPNIGCKNSTETVAVTAGEIVATPLAGRTHIILQNLGNKPVFIGSSGTVTTANGIKLESGASMDLPFGEDVDIFAISESGSQDVRVFEVA